MGDEESGTMRVTPSRQGWGDAAELTLPGDRLGGSEGRHGRKRRAAAGVEPAGTYSRHARDRVSRACTGFHVSWGGAGEKRDVASGFGLLADVGKTGESGEAWGKLEARPAPPSRCVLASSPALRVERANGDMRTRRL